MVDRDVDNMNLQGNREREEIGRKGSAAGSTGTMQREGGTTPGQNVRQGWNDFRAKVRGKWNQITDNDIDQYQGRRKDEFVNFIGDRVGGDRTSIGRDVDNFSRETNYRWE